MLQRCLIILIYFISTWVYSQTYIDIKIKDKKENKPVENVLAQNISIGTFAFSNQQGISRLKYMDSDDSIHIYFPSYASIKTTIQALKKNNGEVLLRPRTHFLKEVVIVTNTVPKYDYKFDYGNNNKYYITISGVNPAILTSFINKNNKRSKLVAIKFFFDKTIVRADERIFIRPLIYNKDMKELLIAPNMLQIAHSSSGVIINFSENPIPFLKNKMYYLGFEIINKSKETKKLKVRGTTNKKSYFLLRPNPMDDWFKQDYGKGFSLDYELFFIKD